MFAIGFLVAFFFILKEFKKKKIPSIHAYNIGLLVLIGAMIGSRIFYVIENLSYYLSSPLEIFAFWQGGMTSYGGLIFGIFFVWLYTRKNAEIRFLELLDHPTRENQKLLTLRLGEYVYVVPCVLEPNGDLFLKTAFPSRKYKRKYDRGQN